MVEQAIQTSLRFTKKKKKKKKNREERKSEFARVSRSNNADFYIANWKLQISSENYSENLETNHNEMKVKDSNSERVIISTWTLLDDDDDVRRVCMHIARS